MNVNTYSKKVIEDAFVKLVQIGEPLHKILEKALNEQEKLGGYSKEVTVTLNLEDLLGLEIALDTLTMMVDKTKVIAENGGKIEAAL